MVSLYTLCGMLEYMKSVDMNKKGKEAMCYDKEFIYYDTTH